ncbi:MAG: beta-lactamase family protein [Colwellia sp.]|nr:beta-lactamase family protein [Colwellia sp.]
MKRLLTIILFFASVPVVSCAETPPYSPGELDKISNYYVKPLLEVVNSGDVKLMASFIEKNYSPEFLDGYPMAAHVIYMLNASTLNGELSLYSVHNYDKSPTEQKITLILKAERIEAWTGLTLGFSSEKPHKINNLYFTPAIQPGNLTNKKKLTLTAAVDELTDYIQRMADKDVFSGSVLLAKGDKVLYKGAFGLASKRFNVANNLQTKFNLGSMNKMFTSIGIMQLVEAGKLSLNDKLSKFTDQSWLANNVNNKIEIQHLLTHSSGLGSYFNQTYMAASKNSFRELDDYKSLIRGEELQFEPGTDVRYSNTGMFMLGVVIEKVSGENYFDYIREHIYKPAGMLNSDSYEMDQPVPNLAIGYEPDRNNETGWVNNIYLHVLKGGPAGGGFSTVEDLHKFAVALKNYKLLGKELTEQLYSAKPMLHSYNYGYGFNVSGSPEDRIVGHGGAFYGISSNLDIFLDRDYISTVMSNYGGSGSIIVDKINELLARIE